MFPFDLDDDEDIIEEEDTAVKQVDYEIDFATGALTGRIITGLPALVQWIKLAILTEKYFYNQFTWDYGCEINRLIGRENSEEFIISEVTRMLTDTLSGNSDITGLSDVKVVSDRDSAKISFTVNTVYGSEEVATDV